MAPHVVHVHPDLGDYDWVAATSYKMGTVVGAADGGTTYRCKSDHASTSDTEPGVGSSWASVWERYGYTGSGFWGEGRWQYQFVKANGTPLDASDRDWMRVTDPISGDLVYLDDRYSPSPTAAFVFRSPGTYKIRARYQNRDKEWSDWIESSTITVAQNARTKRYVNGATGSDSYDGVSATVSGTHGPKATINGALSLVTGSDYEIEVADDTTCDCTAHVDVGGTGLWIHRSGGGAKKPIVVLKQALNNNIFLINSNSIVEGLEFGYFPIPEEAGYYGRRLAVEIGEASVNTAVVDCEFNEAVELMMSSSAARPTAVLYLRLLQKAVIARYCVFMDGFSVLSILGCTFDKGVQNEHVVRLSSRKTYDTPPYDVNRYAALEYNVFANAVDVGQKSACGTEVRHLGLYRTITRRGSVVIGEPAYPATYPSIRGNVIDGCVLEFFANSPQGLLDWGSGDSVIRTTCIRVDGDNAGSAINIRATGRHRLLNLSVRVENHTAGNAVLENLYGGPDDNLVSGCIWSLVPEEWDTAWTRFIVAPSVARLAEVRWEDCIHSERNAHQNLEFLANADDFWMSLDTAEAYGPPDWADGNVIEAHTFDSATHETLGSGTAWLTKVRTSRGVFRSINGVDWVDAGPAGAWRPLPK